MLKLNTIKNSWLHCKSLFQCDVANEDDVNKMFQWIENNPSLGRVDICIPNAGFSTNGSLMEGIISIDIKIAWL